MRLNEEEVKTRFVLPYLANLGIAADEIQVERSFTLKLGKAVFRVDNGLQVDQTQPRLDILITRGGKNLCVLEIKAQGHKIDDRDIEQATSYGRLVHPVVPFCIITNTKETRIVDTISREDIDLRCMDFDKELVPTVAEDLKYEAARLFLGYSLENLLNLSRWQVKQYSKLVTGSVDDQDKKYIPEVYVTNDEMETAFTEFLTSSSLCFAFVGDSGIGKTCWSCATSSQLLDQKQPVLFYRAVDIPDGVFAALANDLNWVLSPDYSETMAVKRFLDTFSNSGVIIVLDGLDEIGLESARRLTDDLLRRIEGRKVKLAVTCKTTVWPDILMRDGIPTLLQQSVFRIGKTPGFVLHELPPKQFYTIVEKYRRFYHCKGLFESGAQDEAKRNLFLLRVMFEVAAETNANHLPFTSASLLEEYYSQILRRFNASTRDAVREIVNMVAELLFESNSEEIPIERLREQCKMSKAESFPERLFDLPLLQRTENATGAQVSFYFGRIRDYLLAFHVLRLHQKNTSELGEFVTSRKYSGVRLDALSLYYQLSETTHKRVIDESVYSNAVQFTKYYESLLNTHTPTLREVMPPYSKGKVGFVGYYDLVRRKVGMYGFRSFKEGNDRVLLIPSQRGGDYRSNAAYLAGARNLHWTVSSGSFVKIDVKREAFWREFRESLQEVIEAGKLDESGCASLLTEKIIAICGSHYINNLGNNKRRNNNILPLSLSNLETENREYRAFEHLSSELRNRSIKQGKIVPNWSGNTVSYSYHISDVQLAELHKNAKDLASSASFEEIPRVQKNTDDIQELLQRSVENLRTLGYVSIENSFVPLEDNRTHFGEGWWTKAWRRGTLQGIVRAFYQAYLDEYEKLVAHNFPTFSKHFELFGKMPVMYLIRIDAIDRGLSGDILLCRNVSDTNTVHVVDSSDYVFNDDDWTVTYRKNEYAVISRTSTFLLEEKRYTKNFLPHDLIGEYVPLRDLVYGTIDEELDAAIIKLATDLGIEPD